MGSGKHAAVIDPSIPSVTQKDTEMCFGFSQLVKNLPIRAFDPPDGLLRPESCDNVYDGAIALVTSYSRGERCRTTCT